MLGKNSILLDSVRTTFLIKTSKNESIRKLMIEGELNGSETR